MAAKKNQQEVKTIDSLLFRCSSLGELFTEPKTKAAKEAGEFSETAKKRCLKEWLNWKYGLTKELRNKFVEKGKLVEEEAITILTQVDKAGMYVNNKTRLSNKWITGEWDILKSDIVRDIKSSWDYETFFAHLLDKKIDSNYEWQLQGYMMLTGAKSAELVYVLCDTPEHLIEAEKTNVWYKMGQPLLDDPAYLEVCAEIERNMTYGDKLKNKEDNSNK